MAVPQWLKWLASLVGIGKTDWTGESFKANFRLMRSQEKRLELVESRLDKCEERHIQRDVRERERDRRVMELERLVAECGEGHEQTALDIADLKQKIQ